MSAIDAASPGRRYLLALAAGALAVVLGAVGLVAPLDDTLQRWLTPPQATPPIPPSLVLTIDAADPWPWPNGRLADLLDRLRDAGARGVAVDLPVQAGADPEGDARLARTLLDNRVVLGVALVAGADGLPQARLPSVEFADSARLGHLQLPQDRDGRIREHLSYVVAADGVRWPSLAQVLVQPGNSSNDTQAAERWRIGAAPAAAASPTLRAADVLSGRIGASRLHGHWVLVGLGNTAQQPRLAGPFGSAPLYPVEHEARALVALLRGATPRDVPAVIQALLSLLLAGIPLLVGLAGNGRGGRMPACLLAGIAASLALCAWLLGRQLWFAPGGAVAVLSMALLAWTVLAVRRHLRERRATPGLAPRRRLEAALDAARAAGQPHALLLFDIATPASADEHHSAAACHLAQLLRERARRPGDVAAHLGAGRFALLLPGTPAGAAEHILDDIRQATGQDGAAPIVGTVHGCSGEPCDCAGRLGTASIDRSPSPA